MKGLTTILGNYTSFNKKRVNTIVNVVNSYSSECKNITNSSEESKTIGLPRRMSLEEEAFYNKTEEFRKRLRNGETINDIIGEALAVCREATRRRLGMFPYDTQIEAAIAMIGDTINKENRENIIAEMKTGEGKTLVQILVAYIDILEATKDLDKSKWSNVHIMTSNDALARRDALNNGKVFSLLGLTCGFVPSRKSMRGKTVSEQNIYKYRKQQAYMSDIVYATTSTIAFDYLNDNTIYDIKLRNINRPFGYAIVDEADDLLIDQAANPLILSSSSGEEDNEYETSSIYKWATEFLYGDSKLRGIPLTYKEFDKYEDSKSIPTSEDYVFYDDENHVFIKDRIVDEISKLSNNDPDLTNLRYIALQDCILARHSYKKDIQYGIQIDKKDNNIARVVLISANTGRNKTTSKYMNGIQEAIEAKEDYLENSLPNSNKRYRIEFTKRNRTKAMCTYPDFLSLYKGRVCGMTGTSDKEEFRELYGFETYEVKTRKKNIRFDYEDQIFMTKKEKYDAIINEIIEAHKNLEPVLIGTTSVEESKEISSLLKKNGIRHQLLNAENEEEENKIIETAGLIGSVTVSTNMAGRGTDIKLGEGVKELGGLYVISTSKNNSVRIDNQLKGRAARQGDPGKTICYCSLEDKLVRVYYPNDTLMGFIDQNKHISGRVKDPKAKSIIDRAQASKEGLDKSSRITSEKFNKVFTEQKEIIYSLRNKILEANNKDFITYVSKIMSKYIIDLVDRENYQSVETKLNKIVDTKSCYSTNSREFKENLYKGIHTNFRNCFGEKITNNEIDEYVKDMRVKFLKIIDDYWTSYFDILDLLKKKMNISVNDDVFKLYEREANEVFGTEVYPSILNEMIAYAIHPSMKYGEYQIDNSISEELEMKLVI